MPCTCRLGDGPVELMFLPGQSGSSLLVPACHSTSFAARSTAFAVVCNVYRRGCAAWPQRASPEQEFLPTKIPASVRVSVLGLEICPLSRSSFFMSGCSFPPFRHRKLVGTPVLLRHALADRHFNLHLNC